MTYSTEMATVRTNRCDNVDQEMRTIIGDDVN